MILVILGTQDKSFDRLLKEIDKQIKNNKINEKVVVQAGSTKYKSENMEIFDLIPMRKFNNLIEEADLIITHGGVGSILSSLRKNKKVIAIPRLSKYKEHTNDHQIQIVNKFEEDGYILGCKNVSKLEKKLEEIKNFVPKSYKGSNKLMINTIENFIKKN